MPSKDHLFKPGQSGNPGGKPKAVKAVIEASRKHTEEAVETLARWMRSDDARASVAACQALLDRGWGKAAQVITTETDEHGNAPSITVTFVRPPSSSDGSSG